MKTTQSLDRQNRTSLQLFYGSSDDILHRDRFASGIAQTQMRTADRAGVRLCVKAAVTRIVVFPRTSRAQCETRHAGVGAVIGQGGGNGVAGAAMRAVDEGITVTAIIRIEQFTQTVTTCGRIWRDLGADCTNLTDGNQKGGFLAMGDLFADAEVINPGQRWWLLQGIEEVIQRGRGALNLDTHSCAIVTDKTAQLTFHRQPINEWAKSHALYLAGDSDSAALWRIQVL